MSKLFNGYYIREDDSMLFNVLVVADTRKQGYEKYKKFHEEALVNGYDPEQAKFKMLPIEKFRFEVDLEDLDRNTLEMFACSDYAGVYADGEIDEEDELWNEVMSDDFDEEYIAEDFEDLRVYAFDFSTGFNNYKIYYVLDINVEQAKNKLIAFLQNKFDNQVLVNNIDTIMENVDYNELLEDEKQKFNNGFSLGSIALIDTSKY